MVPICDRNQLTFFLILIDSNRAISDAALKGVWLCRSCSSAVVNEHGYCRYVLSLFMSSPSPRPL